MATTLSMAPPRRHAAEPRAVRWTRRAFAGMFVAGAAGHVAFASLSPEIYEGFADTSWLPIVREGWHDLVVPHARLFGAGMAAFELGLGILFTRRGRATRVAVALAVAFHLALIAFGWWYLVWSLPMIAALVWFGRASRRGGDPEGHGT